jgi:hypothetical protein
VTAGSELPALTRALLNIAPLSRYEQTQGITSLRILSPVNVTRTILDAFFGPFGPSIVQPASQDTYFLFHPINHSIEQQ